VRGLNIVPTAAKSPAPRITTNTLAIRFMTLLLCRG
jgi:hypothetical protein